MVDREPPLGIQILCWEVLGRLVSAREFSRGGPVLSIPPEPYCAHAGKPTHEQHPAFGYRSGSHKKKYRPVDISTVGKGWYPHHGGCNTIKLDWGLD